MINPAMVNRPNVRRRATEATIWGMPAVNYDLMRQQMLTKTPGKENQVIYWGKPLDWHNQTLTPNPDTLYFMAFFNTKDVGPVVLEIPPAGEAGSLNANIVNTWQVPLEDAGALGIDKGAGAKFVLLPPGYEGDRARGLHGAATGHVRRLCADPLEARKSSAEDVAKSVAYGKQVKVYPLSQAANPPATVFSDVQAVDFDSTIRYDASYFDNLNRIVQAEPWLDRDRAMIDPLRTLGIEKGKPFAPDAATKEALAAGVREAQQELEARYDAGLPPFYEGTHWTVPAPPELISAAAEGLHRTRPLPRRRARHGLHLRLHRHQAPGRGPVLHDRDQGQGRSQPRWREDVSTARAGRTFRSISTGRSPPTTGKPTR